MIRDKSIQTIHTPAGDRYIYGPQTYRTLAEAVAAKVLHEAEYDKHIAKYHADADRRWAETVAGMVAEGLVAEGVDPATIPQEMITHYLRREGYKRMLQWCGGDTHRVAELYRGRGTQEEG